MQYSAEICEENVMRIISKQQKNVKSGSQQRRERTGSNLRIKLTMLGFLCSERFVTGAKSDDLLHKD